MMKKMNLNKRLLALSSLSLALAFGGTGAMAAASTEQASTNTTAEVGMTKDSPAQKLFDSIAQGQLKLLRTFAGPGNLTGYVVQGPSGMPNIMYIDQQGQYAVFGTLIGMGGENLSEADTQQYVNAYIAKNILAALPNTVQFSEGKADAPNQLYVLADPNCSACNYFYKLAKPFIDEGKLKINWILVAFVQADSEAKAAGIMFADDPAATMAQNEEGFDSSTEEGGAKVPEKLTDEQKAAVAKNMAFMRDAGLSSTPTVMFYNKDGEFEFIKGAPRDLKTFITENNPTDKPAS